MNVFSLFASIELDDKGYNRSLDNAERNTDKFSNNAQRAFDRVGKSAIALGASLSRSVTAPILAVTTAAVAGAVKLGNYADRILDLSQITGLSTDTLQAFEQVAIEAGVSVDTLANSARMLTTRLSATGNESLEFSDAMEAIGVSTTDADGNLRSMDQLMPDLLQGLSGMQDITARNALAMDIFGRSAADILPVLGLGSDRIDELMESAVEMGLVLDGDALDAANAFRIVQEQLRNRLNLVYREINVALIPIMTQLTTFLLQRAVPAFRNLIDRVVSAIEFFNGLSDGVKSTVAVVVSAFAAAGPVVMAVGIVTRAFATLLTPWGLIAAAVAGFVTAYQTNFLGLRDITEPVVTFIVDALGKVITIGRNIVSNWTTVSRGFSLIISSMGELAGSVARLIGAQFNLMRVGVEETFILMGRSISRYFTFIINNVLRTVNFAIAGLNRLGVDIDPLELVQADTFAEITGDFAASIGEAQQAVADARADIGENFDNMVRAAIEFYNMITDDTPAIAEGIESTGEAAKTAAELVEPAFGKEIATALDTTTNSLTEMSTALNTVEADWARFTLAMVERTEGPIETVTDLYEAFSKLGLAVTPELLALVSGRVDIPVPEPTLDRGAPQDLTGPDVEAIVLALSAEEQAREEKFQRDLARNRLIDAERERQIAAETARTDAMQAEEQRREEIAQRELEVLQSALMSAGDFAMGIVGSFESALSGFSSSIVNLFQNILVTGKATMQDLANAVSAGIIAFGNAIAAMATGASSIEDVGTSLAKALLGMVQQLAAMLLATQITALAMGSQLWNPVLAALGAIGAAAAAYGLSELNKMGANTQAEAEPPAGSVAALREERAALVEERDLAVTDAAREELNRQIAEIDERIRRLTQVEVGQDGAPGETTPGDRTPGGGMPRVEPAPSPSFDTMTPASVGASIGSLPQGVQLAVAVPLLDAANAFGSHVSSFGGYIDRLVTEGIAVNMGATSRTAALR